MYVVPPNKRQTFDFEIEGKQYSVPYMKHMPLNKMLAYNKRIKHMKADAQGDEYIAFVADIFNEHAPGAIDNLSVEQFSDLMKAYIAEGQAAAGE